MDGEFPKDGREPVFQLIKHPTFGRNSCPHPSFIVDPELSTVECKKCGEKINPIFVLERFALQESRYFSQLKKSMKRIAIIEEKLKKRTRTKCRHCKKMTNINMNFTSDEIAEINFRD